MNIKYIFKELKKYLQWLLNPTMYTHVYKVSIDYSLITNESLYNKHKIHVADHVITNCSNCGKKLNYDKDGIALCNCDDYMFVIASDN